MENKMREEKMNIEIPFAEFTSFGKFWKLERDKIGNINTQTEGQSELIVDEELVNMDLEDLAILLESSGW